MKKRQPQETAKPFDIDSILFLFANKIGDKTIIKNADMYFLDKYLDYNRGSVLEEKPDGSLSFYITTGLKTNNSCLIEANHGFLKVSEIIYSRVGNGINQEGTLVVKYYFAKEDKLVEDGYAIKLSDLTKKKGKLTYFSDLSDLSAKNFTITIDPSTLDGYGDTINLTDMFNMTNTLVLFKKPLLKGRNMINGSYVVSKSTDLSLQYNSFKHK